MDDYKILKEKILELSRTIDSQNNALNLAAKEYSSTADCSKCKMNVLCNRAYVDFPEYYTPCEEVIKRHWMYGGGIINGHGICKQTQRD